MKLNLGCGNRHRPGWVNVDREPLAQPDQVWDLEELPWPLEDDCAEEILLDNVLEHLGRDSDTFLGIVAELYRVAAPGGTVRIVVPHPRHADHLTDPTHVRPIAPELFRHFSLAMNELWHARKMPGTPLARYLEVDLELVSVGLQLDAHWQRELDGGRLDLDGLNHAISTYNNVVESVDITLRALKPYRGFQPPDVTHVLARTGGMGDVLMALCGARAVKEQLGARVVVATVAQYEDLVRACPHADLYVEAGDQGWVEREQARTGELMVWDLNPGRFGTAPRHQVDAYLEELGVRASAEEKELSLVVPVEAEVRVREVLGPSGGQKRVLLHPSMGDGNRTWPGQRWCELARALVDDGHQVVCIGKGGTVAMQEIGVDGVLDAVDRLEPLEAVALMRASDLLVSTDAGPIQLAAATDIAIVGIYSVVAPEHRLPFRHGEAGWRAIGIAVPCEHHPCYHAMNDPDFMEPIWRKAEQGPGAVADVFANWCLQEDRFRCLRKDLGVEPVLEACRRLLERARESSRWT